MCWIFYFKVGIINSCRQFVEFPKTSRNGCLYFLCKFVVGISYIFYVKTMSLRLVSVIFFTPLLFLSGLLGSGSQTSSWSCPKEIGCKSYWKERENCWGRTWAASRPISWETSPTKVILIWFGLLQPLAYIVSTFWIFGSKITEVGIWTWPFVNCSIVMGEWSPPTNIVGKVGHGSNVSLAFYIVFAIPETFCSRVVSLINSLLGDHSF